VYIFRIIRLTPRKLNAEHKNCTGADGASSGQKTRGCIEGEDPAVAVVGCKIPRKENSPIFDLFLRPPVPVSPGLPEVDPTIDKNKRSA